jgi:hypothetical protein
MRHQEEDAMSKHTKVVTALFGFVLGAVVAAGGIALALGRGADVLVVALALLAGGVLGVRRPAGRAGPAPSPEASRTNPRAGTSPAPSRRT